jgi:endonuclease G
MGRIDHDEALKAAARFRHWSGEQNRAKSEEGDARMLDRRRDLLAVDERVFFESIIDGSDLLPMRYLALGQVAARAVGRLHLPRDADHGDGFATGFLIAPNLLLTNQHVLPTREWARAATLTMDAEDGIDGLPRAPRVFQLDPGRLYVSDPTLDFCVVAVMPKALDGTPLEPFGHLKLFAGTGKIVRGEYATIVQHPNGLQKHIAARNNLIKVYVYDDDLDAEAAAENNFLYYSTDTLGGSSGSPVFSDQWFVVALHRRGVPKTRTVDGRTVILRTTGRVATRDDSADVIAYESNEGVRVSRILARLKSIAAAQGADAAMAQDALARIDEAAGSIADGPVATTTATYSLLNPAANAPPVAADIAVEIVRRKASIFPENLGYNPRFLAGHPLPLPEPSAALHRELAPRLDDPTRFLLPFRHFTTVMHARRRLPVFAVINISGAQKPEHLPPRRPAWSYDPRIDPEHQPDDSIFSSLLQRGHMCARDYAIWGDDAEQAQADIHSFTLTNVCPQIAAFNGVREWYELEREVIGNTVADDYDELRSRRSHAARGTRIRIPLKFWKIVAWVQGGALRHKAFILDQSDELDAAGPLEFDIETPSGVDEVDIDTISAKTDLVFSGF